MVMANIFGYEKKNERKKKKKHLFSPFFHPSVHQIYEPKTTEGYDYYLSPSIFSSFVYINFSKDESENRRGNNLLYPSVSSHLCLGFGYIIKHSVQIPDDESRHRSPRAKKCYPTSGRAVNPKS